MSEDLHDSSGNVHHIAAEQHKLRAYDDYKQYVAMQKELQMREYYGKVISDALKGLTSLKLVKLSLAPYFDNAHLNSNQKAQAFEPTLHSPWGDPARARQLGVAQLESILLGVVDHGLEIEELHCGQIHWQFFKESDEHFNSHKLAVRALKRLEMHISNRSSLEDPEEDIDAPPDPQSLIECAKFFADGRLREFTTAAPHLKEMCIAFDYQDPVSPAHLRDIVGEFTWPALRCVHFSHITVNETRIIHFFARHATTLREVSLDFLKLDSGDWISVFRRMAKVLRLEMTALSGEFPEENRLWDFDVHTGRVFRFKCMPDVVATRMSIEYRGPAELGPGINGLKVSDLQRLVEAQEFVLNDANGNMR